MEERKLTKADIDKVRHIEGFPIGKDEDIIALSRPPYYTACPNPFIEDFIRENGTPYDEATDDYHREPFAADVSEGKGDVVYGAHNYHTKVPHKAIMRYILHYTMPGDIVFDGFCGTGMTGVAAQFCGCPDQDFRLQTEQEMGKNNIGWGGRKAILSDLSPAATFIAHNYNTTVDVSLFQKEAKRIMDAFEIKYGWMYKTLHSENGHVMVGLDGNPVLCHINYTVWSDLFICPSCIKEFSYLDVAFDFDTKDIREGFVCPHCGAKLKKKDCAHATETYYDELLQDTVTIAKQIPVLINYTFGKKKYDKRLEQYDVDLLGKIATEPLEYDIPLLAFPQGDKTSEPIRLGLKYIHQIYTRRNIIALSYIMDQVRSSTLPLHMRFLFEQVVFGMAKIARYVPTHFSQVNQYLSGTLYIGSKVVEAAPSYIISNKINQLSRMYSNMKFNKGDVLVNVASATRNG